MHRIAQEAAGAWFLVLRKIQEKNYLEIANLHPRFII
jgi:hypothetical protein